MGIYDTFVDGERSGQVKIWFDSFRVIEIGDEVPDHNGVTTFSIAMREGGFVNIKDKKFHSWTDTAAYDPVFDKYGDKFSEDSKEDSKGLFHEFLPNDPYLFEDLK